MAEKDNQNVIFMNLSEDSGPAEIESLCVNCGENGTTRLLLTKIPHFKEIILMAFECPHCGFKNNEIQSGQAMNEKGIETECTIENKKDMNRQIVKSEFATIKIPTLDFEIPPTNRAGLLTTVEGCLRNIYDGLSQGQPVRKIMDPEGYEKLEGFLQKLQDCIDLTSPFVFQLHDPSGNSYVENLCAPKQDPQIHTTWYERSEEENEFLGLAKPLLEGEEQQEEVLSETEKKEAEEIKNQVLEFPSNCSNCNQPVVCKMHVIDIPFFKEVVIMASACDHCGFKSNEVKSGGAIAPLGKKITLKITDSDDLSRDILKSESCLIRVPEIDLELAPGTLGGKFTTIEGLLQQVHDELRDRNPFYIGDSAPKEEEDTNFNKFLADLQELVNGGKEFTLIVDDCLGNSYLQNLYAPDPDPNMTIEEYERTWDQNELFGLNDLVENPEEADDDEHTTDKKEEES